MSGDPHLELGESLPRFLSHWLAACFGHFLMVLLPLITDWAQVKNATWPSWWSLLLFAASTSLVKRRAAPRSSVTMASVCPVP